ncbi:MAG: lipopolysaccharide biosynthesis protein [Marinobacter sp.]|uniref:lipopolysaccharide biosynthesis protein n=1 Tax=Marinobacter sp. TaxID=50741 RepID=UPI00329A40DB
MSDFRGRVLKALSWTAGGKVVSQVISMGFGIALARMLTPDDFGLIAMMMVFTGFAGLLMDVGLGSALVQKKDVQEIHYNTVFWTNLGLGVGLWALVSSLSPFIAEFYGREELTDLGLVLSLQFILGALGLVPRQRLVKDLSFQVTAVADLLGMIVGGTIAVFMVSQGYGYWGLAWQPVILRFVATCYVWGAARWVPAMAFSGEALKELFGFSFYVFATRVIRFATMKADKLLAGKYIGGDAAGLLDKAHSMMLFPLQNVSHTVGSVMFPALSLIQSDRQRIRKVYMRSTQAIALLTFPMMAGIFAVSENFVFGVLGEQWAELVPLLQILCLAGVARSIVTVTGAIYLSLGRAKLQFKVNLLTRPIALAGVIAGLPWGVEGIVIGMTTATWINSLITLSIAGRLINLSLLELMLSFFRTLAAAVLMAIGIILLDRVLYGIGPLGSFGIQVLAGGGLYVMFAFVLRIKALTDVLDILKSQFAKRRSNV